MVRFRFVRKYGRQSQISYLRRYGDMALVFGDKGALLRIPPIPHMRRDGDFYVWRSGVDFRNSRARWRAIDQDSLRAIIQLGAQFFPMMVA